MEMCVTNMFGRLIIVKNLHDFAKTTKYED